MSLLPTSAAMRVQLFALLALVLAGCAGDSTTSPGFDEDSPVSRPGLGCIRGVVVDEGIRPIAGVQVRLTPGTRNMTGDADGLFTFCDLEPGTYFVSASAPLYLEAQTSVDVVADGAHDIRLALPADLSPQPYHRTIKHEAFMQAWGGIGQFVVEEFAPSGLCNCILLATPDPDARTFVVEALWTEGAGNPTNDPWYWILGQTDGDGMYETGYATSPILVHRAASDYSQGSEVYYRQDGPDFGVESEVRFTQFLTIFYREPAPDGWSFVAGSA